MLMYLITGVGEKEPFQSYHECTCASWQFLQPVPHESLSSHMVEQLSRGSHLPYSQTKSNKLCGLGADSWEVLSHLQSSTLLRYSFVFYSPHYKKICFNCHQLTCRLIPSYHPFYFQVNSKQLFLHSHCAQCTVTVH
jgi:hypothetical protein